MQQSKPHLLTLCMLMSFPLVGAVTFTPALAELVEDFGISTGVSQMTVAVYLAGYALGQLPYSCLASYVGNKRTIYTGLGVFVLGSMMCAWAPTFWYLMVGRSVMALGAAVGLVMTFTIVSQFFSVTESRAVFAYTMLSFAIAPGLGNLLGGLLTGYLGWKACFYFLILYAGIVSLFVRGLPEESEKVKRVKVCLKSYLDLFVNMRYVSLALMAALTTAVIYVFASTAPLTAVYLLEVAPQVYGLVSVLPFVGTITGCLLSAELSNRLSARKMIAIGLMVSVCGAVLKWGLVEAFGLHVWSIFVPMPLIYLGLPLVYANGAALGLGMAANKSVGSSIFCMMNIGVSLLAVSMMSWMGISSLTKMSIVFLGIMCLMVVFYLVNFTLSRKLGGQIQSDCES